MAGIAARTPLTAHTRPLVPEVLRDGPALVFAPGGQGMFLSVQDPELGTQIDPATCEIAPIIEDGHLVWALNYRVPAGGPDPATLGREPLHALVADTIAAWHPRLRSLFAAVDPASLAVFPFYAAAPVPSWPSQAVTVLGDAIHVMPSTGGVGGSTAIRDAHRLAGAIAAAAAGDSTLTLAVHDYEATMLRDGFAAVRRSLRPLRGQQVFTHPLAFHLATRLALPAADRVLARTHRASRRRERDRPQPVRAR